MSERRDDGLAAAIAVENRLYAALALLRVVVLLNAIGVAVVERHEFTRPGIAAAVLAAMTVWTAVASAGYADPTRRDVPLLGLDLVLTLAALASTPLVKGADFGATVPGFWVMGALLSWAVRWRRVGGVAAGVAIAALDLALRSHIGETNYGNAFLLVIGGITVGYVAGSIKQMAAERDRAERVAAAAAERARLARVVHDGVLQVLAMVQRRGGELGGSGAELARLAGEQETALRTLIRSQAAVTPTSVAGAGGGVGAGATIDLADRLGRFDVRPGVDVALPGGAVDLPAAVAAEVVAVVGACLDNVARHVGEGAPAWVLLEAFGDRVEVSVRDEGPGIDEGRLERAEAEGRLGVAESIRGRIRDLGGEARLTTGPNGSEWEFVVPR